MRCGIRELEVASKRSRDEFIAKRAELIRNIQLKREAFEELEELSEDLMSNFKWTSEDWNAEKLFPSLFKEPVNEEAYEKEKAKFEKKFLVPIEKVQAALMKKAAKDLGLDTEDGEDEEDEE